MTIDEILGTLYCDGITGTFPSKERYVAQAKAQLREAVKGAIPPRKSHWIQHGDIGHPHETQEDIIHNQAMSDITQRLSEVFGEEKI